MALQESGQMYLESILVLSKTGKAVRSIDVSEYMGFSKPSVSRAIGLLKSGGYITVSKEGHLHLTEEGLRVAENIYEKHTLLTQFLIRIHFRLNSLCLILKNCVHLNPGVVLDRFIPFFIICFSATKLLKYIS